MDEIYGTIYLSFGVATIVLQWILHKILRNKPNMREKIWNMILGISVASIISDVLICCFTSKELINTGARIGLVILCAAFLITHIILCVKGVEKRNEYKEENIKFNKNFVITGLLVILIAGILIPIPKIIKETSVINYLKDKYGDDKYEIVDMYELYSYNAWVSKNYNGYSAIVKAHKANKEYTIDVSSSGSIKDATPDIDKISDRVLSYLKNKYKYQDVQIISARREYHEGHITGYKVKAVITSLNKEVVITTNGTNIEEKE
jgi:hypothetical protein